MMRFLAFLLVLLLAAACDVETSENGQGADASGATSPSSQPTSALPPQVALPTLDRTVAGNGYVGSAACASCHQQQHNDWLGSHHDQAMQPANASTVLGDFNQARFDYYGVASTFFRRGDDYWVRTDGANGELTDFRIAYTFGVYPLQQYLIEFPGGRLQALNIVWDARPVEAGGQRWYHLYPDEAIRAGDELHWTGINHNWNFMCADCHSTDLQKHYDLDSDSYETTWAEIDVSCEACHGPAQAHLQWAQQPDQSVTDKGFAVAYTERRGAHWQLDAATGNAARKPVKTTHVEIEQCARCHSRRATMFPGDSPGKDFHDYFRLSLLELGLYHADGQVDGEVYVYGSFLQSKMYHAGVTCSDCHNPHSLGLRLEGNDLCGQCHLATKYDNETHHFHRADSAGAQCINCHMPTKTYMGVDARRDHSFRIPRPDLSVTLHTPNACNQCHSEQSAGWAVEQLRARKRTPKGSAWAATLAAGRSGQQGADVALQQLAFDQSQPAIVRATAVSLLPGYFSPTTAQALQAIAQGDESLLSLGLVSQLQFIPEQYRAVFAVPLLYEPDAVTRALAASHLPLTSLPQFPEEVVKRYDQAIEDYERSQRFNADRPESLVNLAMLSARRQDNAAAVGYFQQAIARAPYFVPAWVNFADYYYRQGEEKHGQAILREGLTTVREKQPLHHALGLSLVRSGQREQALEHLRASAEGEGSSDYFRYVYGVALNSLGYSQRAIEVLEQAHRDYPDNRQVIAALASIYRDLGNSQQADYWQSKL